MKRTVHKLFFFGPQTPRKKRMLGEFCEILFDSIKDDEAHGHEHDLCGHPQGGLLHQGQLGEWRYDK